MHCSEDAPYYVAAMSGTWFRPSSGKEVTSKFERGFLCTCGDTARRVQEAPFLEGALVPGNHHILVLWHLRDAVSCIGHFVLVDGSTASGSLVLCHVWMPVNG